MSQSKYQHTKLYRNRLLASGIYTPRQTPEYVHTLGDSTQGQRENWEINAELDPIQQS